jgi:hypothetical protein
MSYYNCQVEPDWFDSKICLAKIRASQNIGKNFLLKSWQVLCEVGYFFGFQPNGCQNLCLPKLWQGKFWNQTNQAHSSDTKLILPTRILNSLEVNIKWFRIYLKTMTKGVYIII